MNYTVPVVEFLVVSRTTVKNVVAVEFLTINNSVSVSIVDILVINITSNPE